MKSIKHIPSPKSPSFNLPPSLVTPRNENNMSANANSEKIYNQAKEIKRCLERKPSLFMCIISVS
jgi:hypothetical protein